MLTTYCETVQAFRVLRVDCIQLVTPQRKVRRVLADFHALHRSETREAAVIG